MRKILLVLFFLWTASPINAGTLVTKDFSADENPITGFTACAYDAGWGNIIASGGVAYGELNQAPNCAYYNAAINADQWAQVTISQTDGTQELGWNGVAVRLSASEPTYYLLEAVWWGGVGYYGLIRWNNGTPTEIYFAAESFVVGDVIRLEVEGTVLRMFRNNVQVGPDEDDGVNALVGGYPAMLVFPFTANDAIKFDNFVAGDFVAAPPAGKKRMVVIE